MTHALLTGSAGFVGSHVLRHLLTNTDWTFALPVTFRHRGLPARIADATQDRPEWRDRIDIVLCDLTSPIDSVTAHRFGPVDVVMNVASESHVDRSITDPGPFIRNNTDLMVNVLEYAVRARPRLVLQMSTDEVYGPAHEAYRHREWDTIAPSNPYSASKAAQEAISFAYWRTYGVPLILTNTMNVYGQAQDAEKFVPKTIRSLLLGKQATVHTAPDGTPGSRFYLHARNLADAWLHLARTHTPAEYRADGVTSVPSRFHIVGEREVNNVEMVHLIADAMGIRDPLIEPVSFHSSRPGHDLRYALDGSKLAATGWSAPVPFEESLKRTVYWYLKNPEWLRG